MGLFYFLQFVFVQLLIIFLRNLQTTNKNLITINSIIQGSNWYKAPPDLERAYEEDSKRVIEIPESIRKQRRKIQFMSANLQEKFESDRKSRQRVTHNPLYFVEFPGDKLSGLENAAKNNVSINDAIILATNIVNQHIVGDHMSSAHIDLIQAEYSAISDYILILTSLDNYKEKLSSDQQFNVSNQRIDNAKLDITRDFVEIYLDYIRILDKQSQDESSIKRIIDALKHIKTFSPNPNHPKYKEIFDNAFHSEFVSKYMKDAEKTSIEYENLSPHLSTLQKTIENELNGILPAYYDYDTEAESGYTKESAKQILEYMKSKFSEDYIT